MHYTQFWGATYLSEDLAAASRRIIELGKAGQAMSVRLLNANSIATADKDDNYRDLINSPGINYPDGVPLATCLSLIARMRGGGQREQVRGPSLFEETIRQSQGSGLTHLFFGGGVETIEDLERHIAENFPGVKVSAYVSPPIASAERLVELGREAHDRFGGDVIWLGLGQPKQDVVGFHLAEAISRPCIGVGAAFDFLAGRIPVAPRWMQATGLEWLYRFVQEPRRLWRRYTYGNLRFLKVASRELSTTLKYAIGRG